ncbi:hypothetical protein [Candidatus Nanohalobium constans]|uniref:Uncharacterized protein n=1 Tax=Candidatus Nanohalobium constans TaxID=2565781 RepID=A0A5Q0UGA7_9ARCH|nr:hypothetical protein [Candidatus Nanohalobium constans]QGA80240.1 hypothetical protein LC1Nh_0339 [Candidatus Nanohalobium constans]
MRNNSFILVLGLLTLVVVSSGCIDAEASLSMEEVGGTDLGEKASVDIVNMHIDFERVIQEGTSLTTENPPRDVLENGIPVLYNGSLYSLNRTEAGKKEGILVKYKAEKVGKSQGDEVNLITDEADMVDMILDQAGTGSNISIMTYNQFYSPEDKNESVLIDRNDTTFSRENTTVRVTKELEENSSEKLYNYTSKKVASNLSEYSSQLREKYLFELDASNLSEEFIQKAIEETYYGDETEELNRVLEALKEGQPVEEDGYSRTWIVDYRGNTFWVEARAPSLEQQSENDAQKGE